MPSTALKRRWTEEGMRGKIRKPQKKIKRQRHYYSSSDDEEGAADAPKDVGPVSFDGSDEEARRLAQPLEKSSANATEIGTKKPSRHVPKDEAGALSEDSADEDEQEEDQVEDSDTDVSEASEGSEVSETSTTNQRKIRKRNDPEAFATSISKILGTKLTTQKRAEPILSRSKSAQETNKTLSDHKLTVKAHRTLLADKKAAQEKGRVRDVLGLDKAEVSTAEIVAEEKRLRRTAQKGVIKLFNAVRAAQVKAEQAEKDARQKGVVGMAKREEAVKEMSKQGFLDMITGGGKQEGSVEA
ncbi:Rrp15p-domain-containing protein [Lindgomyces ingoldianus]|uniref:Rrp15p-domain-containing protein n=1 Tax=Lindgomyces ingoldianus TaxID=673940 RepID=A0ACB6QSW2_9PLEO|nr:Rrp15p-domain-containing protein [Lindgomyces ingoldianus]KAF2469615.1 Rrp15p-domain-containing protein [Lindgomyces ingoldianus]